MFTFEQKENHHTNRNKYPIIEKIAQLAPFCNWLTKCSNSFIPSALPRLNIKEIIGMVTMNAMVTKGKNFPFFFTMLYIAVPNVDKRNK
jgi:hypothetical protein